MDQTQLIHMLLAVRAQLEAMHAQVNAALSALCPPEPGTEASCRHPPEKRVNTTAQGGASSWLCTECGYQHKDP